MLSLMEHNIELNGLGSKAKPMILNWYVVLHFPARCISEPVTFVSSTMLLCSQSPPWGIVDSRSFVVRSMSWITAFDVDFCSTANFPSGRTLKHFCPTIDNRRNLKIFETNSTPYLSFLSYTRFLCELYPFLVSKPLNTACLGCFGVTQLLVHIFRRDLSANAGGLFPSPLPAILFRGEPLSKEVIDFKPSVVLAADCVYFEPAFPLLLTTLASLLELNPSAIIYFCFKKRRRADMQFLAKAMKKFRVTELMDEDREVFRRESIFLYAITSKGTSRSPGDGDQQHKA